MLILSNDNAMPCRSRWVGGCIADIPRRQTPWMLMPIHAMKGWIVTSIVTMMELLRALTRSRATTAMASLAMLFSGGAAACTASVQFPITADRQKPGYSENIQMLFDGGTNVPFTGCRVGDLELSVEISGPGLRWVMDLADVPVWPVDGPLPLYEVAPDSALIGFMIGQGERKPLRIGENATIIQNLWGSDNIIVNAFVFTRGQRMSDTQLEASMRIRSIAYPTLDTTVPISIKMGFPATTCSMKDVSETLQDVGVTELASPGDTAKEKSVSFSMDCGVSRPRADVALADAGDSTNRGSILSATSDSTAGGVRVQLLSAGTEVQFGKPWFFNPGGGGIHDFTYTARYIRTNEPLLPGVIKGEAVLNVDYW